MLTLTRKQILFIILISLIPLLLTATVFSLSMRRMEEDFTRLKEEYSREISEERREEVQLNYLREKGWQLKNAQETMFEKTEGLPENYSLILSGSASRGAASINEGSLHLYRLENSSQTLSVTDIYLSGKGAWGLIGTFEIRGAMDLWGNISGRVEGSGYIICNGSPTAGEVLQNVSGYVEGELGVSQWSLWDPASDAYTMGGGELNVEGSVYGYISGELTLRNFTGYLLSASPLSLPAGADVSPELQSVSETVENLGASHVLPRAGLELFFPPGGGILPLNLTLPRFSTLLRYLDEWDPAPSEGFITPPSCLHPSTTLYILANITSPAGPLPVALSLTPEDLCRYMEWNLPPGYRALSEEPVVHYSRRGYEPGDSIALSSNFSCTLFEGEDGTLWVIYTNTSVYGNYLVVEVPGEEIEGILPPPGTQFTGRLEEVFQSQWEALRRVRLYIIFGIALSASFLVLLSYYGGRRLTGPISHIIEGTRRVMRDLKGLGEEDAVGGGVRIEPIRKEKRLTTGDELEELLDEINSMIEALNTAFGSLSKAAAEREKALRSLRKSYMALLETARGLERNEEEMNRFLANISHELRTPLHIMMGRLELLKRKGPEELDHFIEVFSRNLKRLQLLLEDLMAVSMIETGRFTLQRREVDLVGVTREVVDVMSEDAARKGVLLTEKYGGELWCSVDPGRIQAAIRNVLDNAIKFSPEGSRVLVEVRGGERWAVVSVEDSGPGIPLSEQKRVFRRFYQVDSSSRRKCEGIGMGLYLVKNIVEMHGGHVTLESREGRGTRVEIFLPREEYEKDTDR